MLDYHPSFELPEGDQRLWRYMGVEKYLSLLTESKLHFTSSSTLDDKWEGELPVLNRKQIASGFDELGHPELTQTFEDTDAIFKRMTHVHCWHESDCESAAMWKLYGADGNNLAIVSTIEMIRAALSFDAETKIYYGRVKYIDYDRDFIPGFNRLLPFLRKRKSFEFEKEVRLIYLSPDDSDEPRGIEVQVDLKRLIGRVFVSPGAADWYVRAIQAITEKFGLPPQLVTRSSLRDPRVK